MSLQKVTIIVVNYNGAKYIDKCLNSLTKQNYKNYEIIVVDNASTDDSPVFVKEKYPYCKLIQLPKNLGFAGGNNVGINEAQGELILLINNDTWVEPDFLHKMVKFYHESRIDVVGPHEARYDGKKIPRRVITIDPLGHPVYLKATNGHLRGRRGFYLCGVCLLFSKALYRETGGFDEDFFMYYEDVDWFWRLNLLNKSFSYVPDTYVFHAKSSTKYVTINYHLFLWRNRNVLQMLLKNYSWFNLLWIIPLYILENILEILAFLIMAKPTISLSYLQGWLYNIAKLSKTLKKRAWVQRARKVPDSYIFSTMYIGFTKLAQLKYFLWVRRNVE